MLRKQKRDMREMFTIPPLTGKAAEWFEEYDRRPLTRQEKASLKRAREVYEKIKVVS